jgi:hypothetical protein
MLELVPVTASHRFPLHPLHEDKLEVQVSYLPSLLRRIKGIQDLNILYSLKILNPKYGFLAVRVVQIMNPVKIKE